MADIIGQGGRAGNKQVRTRYRDMGDGTHAELVAVQPTGRPIQAADGSFFNPEGEKLYTHDAEGRIATVTVMAAFAKHLEAA